MSRTPRQPGQTATPEDTRMQRQRMQNEAEKTQQSRTGELSMITATETADDTDGVWDGQSQELIESGMTTEQRDHLEAQNAGELAGEDDIIDQEDAQRSPLTAAGVPQGMGPNGLPIGDTLSEDPDVIHEARAENQGKQRNDAELERVPLPDTPKVGLGEAPARQVRHLNRSQATRVVRLNATLDPTIGQGPDSQWHFVKGKRYRVPIHVANHLAEKGYIAS